VREQYAHIALSEEEEKQLVKEVLYKTIGDDKNLTKADKRLREQIQNKVPKTINEFLIAFKQATDFFAATLHESSLLGEVVTKSSHQNNNNNKNNHNNNRDKKYQKGGVNGSDNNNKNNNNNNNPPQHHTNNNKKSSGSNNDEPCDVCGRSNHTSSTCMLKYHPNANHSSIKWIDSHFGKLFAAQNKTTLPMHYDIDGNKVPTSSEVKQSLNVLKKNSSSNKRKRGDNEINLFKCSLSNENNKPSLINKILNLEALLDTGSINANYISLGVEKELIKEGAKRKKCNKLICSGFNSCTSCFGSYNLFLTFFNEINKINEVIPIECSVIDTDFDLIVGRKTIKEFSLISKLPSQDLMGVNESGLWEGRSLIQTTISNPDELPNPKERRKSIETILIY
jgi:hypothetical protein